MTYQEYDIVKEAVANSDRCGGPLGGSWKHGSCSGGSQGGPLHSVRRGADFSTPGVRSMALCGGRWEYDGQLPDSGARPHGTARRYYRLMVTGRDAGPAEAGKAAEAFRAVAFTWMARSQVGRGPAGRC